MIGTEYESDGRADSVEGVALTESQERYLYTITLSPMIAWTADKMGGIIDVDDRGLLCFGLTADEARGDGFFAVVHPDDRERLAQTWQQYASLGHPIDQEVRMRMRDGRYRWHRSRAAPRRAQGGAIIRWYGTIEDIHDRKLAHDALKWTAEHDGLTGLWNRGAFQQRLKRAIERSDREAGVLALMLIDVDNFKLVNDQLGHEAGDALLRLIAGQLGNIPGVLAAGRLGGDEFGLFMSAENQKALAAALEAAEEIFDEPLSDNERVYEARLSAGVALYPADGSDIEVLRRNADLALYDAKRRGGISYFSSEMRSVMQTHLSAISVARDIVNGNRITPYYQPKIHLETGEVVGFEALLRWGHPSRGMQTPAPIAVAFEEMDLALAIGDHMRALVAADLRNWLDQGIEFGRIAINVSSAEVRDRNFVSRWLKDLSASSVPPSVLEIEVTESVLLGRNVSEIRRVFDEFKEAGVSIALDDFGTGYASLAHLKQFPVDVLKIDRSFVQELSDNCNNAIVRAILGLGQNLGIETVAEGVETIEQAQRLRRKGCRLAQGFLFSAAVPASSVPSLIERRWPL